jgi:hypothetical protein
VSPRTNRVVARIAAGDGPAGMAFDGNNKAWVITNSRLDFHGLTVANSTVRIGDNRGYLYRVTAD